MRLTLIELDQVDAMGQQPFRTKCQLAAKMFQTGDRTVECDRVCWNLWSQSSEECEGSILTGLICAVSDDFGTNIGPSIISLYHHHQTKGRKHSNRERNIFNCINTPANQHSYSNQIERQKGCRSKAGHRLNYEAKTILISPAQWVKRNTSSTIFNVSDNKSEEYHQIERKEGLV